MKALVRLGWIGTVAAALALIAASAFIRHPAVVGRGLSASCVFVVFALVVAGLAALLVKASTGRGRVYAAGAVVALLLAANATAAARIYQANSLRDETLAAPPGELQAVARHVIAGYYTMDEARSLAKAGVAGLFVSPRNIRGQTIQQVTRDIADLQALRASMGLPRLWIAADEEGGIVSNLSPLLKRPPTLASVAANGDEVIDLAHAVAADLERLGINLNFAPVVDVNRGQVDPSDRYTRIAMRSISFDPDTVASVADLYCRTLVENGVQCTIKHFPGIGAVTTDTHVATAHIATPEARDLAPFRRLTRLDGPQPWVMLSHVIVDRLDASHPSSAAPPVIALLRQTFGFDGILVTDDASMAAYRADLATNAVSSLVGGADIVLASYDPDVAFSVLAILIDKARRDPQLREAMARSDRRLQGLAPRRPPLNPQESPRG